VEAAVSEPRGAGKVVQQRITLPAAAASAAVVREFVRASARIHSSSLDWVDELVLGVNEAFSNAVCHGSGGPGDPIDLAVDAVAEGVFVELQYRGEAFDCHIRELPGDVFHHGGRGRFLMQQLLDGEEYMFDDGMTTLRVFKHF
jgi:anti-sigma regulatory factor (Ser/Thr protein kinase)